MLQVCEKWWDEWDECRVHVGVEVCPVVASGVWWRAICGDYVGGMELWEALVQGLVLSMRLGNAGVEGVARERSAGVLWVVKRYDLVLGCRQLELPVLL